MHANIILVGVGGTGLSSLAYLFHDLGYQNIIGIDSHESEITKKLQAHGVEIHIGHGSYIVQQDDIIIYSDAAADAPEVQAAHDKVLRNHKRVFPPFTYFQFLGELSKYFTTVSIAGTHGKSTTTALTATTLEHHHPDYGIGIVGASLPQRQGKNYSINPKHTTTIKNIIDHILFPKGPQVGDIMKQLLFVIEADEYNHHFLHLDTDYAIITNIELDHADVFGDRTSYLDTFVTFAQNVRNDIFLLTEAPGNRMFLEHLQNKQNPVLSRITEVKQKRFSFTTLLGSHNHSNASLALACSSKLTQHTENVTEEDLTQKLAAFQGLWRRGEFLSNNNHGIPIITDYGHHPTELASTYIALREKYQDKQLVCLFQPHQARRVMEFWDAFVETLRQFDELIIYDIYTARETLENTLQYASSSFLKSKISTIKSFDDLGNLFAKTAGGHYTKNFSTIEHVLEDTAGDHVIIIFTAGNLDRQVRTYLSQA